VLPQPQYGPALAPVTNMFWANEENAWWQKFASDTEVQSACHQWFGQQTASVFAERIPKLVHRRDKCFDEFEQYVKNETLV